MGDNNIDVLARIERVVREHPDADALRSADGVVPFSELWSRAQGLACRLQELGVRPGDAVGLCVPRSGDLVVGALGIVYAGGCYVAMDPAYPDERLSFMVAESGAQIVVGAAGITGRIDAAHIVDPQQPAPGAPPTRRTIDAGDPAYIVYTSGSTGRPKGVLIEHAGLANLVDWHIDAFALTSSDRTAFMSNPGFDAAVWEIWPSLAAGACLSIPADDIKVDPIALRDWLVTQHISTTFVPTALCDELLALDWPASASLRAMLTGGDVLHRRPRIGLPFRVVNNYGVSEASVVSTSGTVLPADPAADSTDLPTLGSPISGVTLTVVDADGRPVTPGSEGELVIGGVSVGRGYVGHPVHNHGRFFLDADGRRCYRTGDLVCLRPDGELVHLGRLDEQVSIRGLRIELGEITAVLDQHPKVRASAVVAVGSNGSQRLRAFIVGAPGRPPATAELREFLSKRLPAHMIPDDCIMLDELPVTANGKIDRKLLRDSGFDIAGRGDLMAPRNEFEEILVEIVAERLWLPAIGVDEDFFALGGHSMLGAQLSVRIGERFGIEVPLRSVFDNPTVVEMAVEVERLMVADIESMSDDELLEAGALFDAMPRDEEFAG